MSISGISSYQAQSIFASSSVTPSKKQAPQAQSTFGGGDTVMVSDEAHHAWLLSEEGKNQMAEAERAQSEKLANGSLKYTMDESKEAGPNEVQFTPALIWNYAPKLPPLGSPASSLNFSALNRAKDAYRSAMGEIGIDITDSDALYAFSKDPEKMKTVEELFYKKMG